MVQPELYGDVQFRVSDNAAAILRPAQSSLILDDDDNLTIALIY